MDGLRRVPLPFGRVEWGGRVLQMLPPSFERTRSTAEMALAHMAWAGVDRAFAVQGNWYGAANGYVARAAARYPDRFLGFAMVDPRQGRRAARRLEHWVRGRGLRALKVETPGLSGLDLAGENEMVVWRACAELRLPVLFHLRTGRAERVALERVLDEVPGFAAIIAHLGLAPESGWLERVRLAKRPNVWVEISALPAHAGGEYPYRRAQQLLRRAVDEVGAQKILWGSDYPSVLTRATYPQLLNYVKEECAFLSDAERRAILGGNALRFWQWKHGNMEVWK
jgi:predicted TIM-barrel fold metal-dependent hydrolase